MYNSKLNSTKTFLLFNILPFQKTAIDILPGVTWGKARHSDYKGIVFHISIRMKNVFGM